MGTLTYTQMKTEILANLGNRSSFDEDRLVAIMNLSQMRIARYRAWEELETNIEDTFTITASAKTDKFLALPSNTKDIYTFRIITENGQSRKLKRRTTRWLDENIPEPEYYARNKPVYYARFADQLEMSPVPDAEYDYIIRQRFWPTAFDKTAGQTSDLDNKDDMIVALSTNWAFQSLGRLEDSGRWWTVYTNMLKAASLEDSERPDELILPAFEEGPRTGAYYQDPWVKEILK